MTSENARILFAVLGDMLKKASLPPGQQLTREQVLEVMVTQLIEELACLGKCRADVLIEISERIEQHGDDRLRTVYRNLMYEEHDRMRAVADYPEKLGQFLLQATGLNATFERPENGKIARLRAEYSKLENYLRESGIKRPEPL